MARPPVSLESSGVAIVDKPAGMTSHDVVGVARRAFQTRRVGHAGTLDPAATGVLVLGIERGTKLLPYLADDTKSYVATVVVGQATTTEDAEGDIIVTDDHAALDALTVQQLTTSAARMVGDQMQVPSAVSAIKVDGVRAYDRVRRGEEVTLAARPVHIDACRLGESRRREDGCWLVDIEVSCSSGTYIRALARDFSDTLGLHAHVATLRRTRVGCFTIDQARPLQELMDARDNGLKASVDLSLDEVTRLGRAVRHLTIEEAQKVALGQRISPNGMPGIYVAVDPAGHTVALMEERDDRNGQRSVKSIFVARPATLQ